MAQRKREVIGPSMSPTPESEDNREATQVSAAAAPPPPSENVVEQPNQDEQPSKKKKRKKTKEKHAKIFDSDTLVEEVASNESPKKNKKKRRKSLDSEAASQEASAAGDEDATAQDLTKKSKKKKKSRKTHPEPGEDHAVSDERHPTSRTNDVEEQQQQPSPKRRKKRSKKNPTHDSDLLLQNGPQEEGLAKDDGNHGDAESARGDALPERTSSVSQNQASTKKKRSRGQKSDETGGTKISDAQEHLVSHAIGGSPPSAQPSSANGSHDRDPGEDDVSVIPDSQQQPPQSDTTQLLDPSQIKREPREDGSDLDEDVRFQFTGIAADFAEAVTDPVAETRRENDPESGLGWLHKRDHAPQETPLLTGRATLLNAGLPDLQPSQVKTEPRSDSHSNSDNNSESVPTPSDGSVPHSPSVQRLERMSRSRSRSASRAPSRSGFLADQTVSGIPQKLTVPSPDDILQLGLVTNARPDPYEQVPYSAPSSTGSNQSIPARLPSPSSTGSERSVPAHVDPQSSSRSRSSRIRNSEQAGGHDSPVNADAMNIDKPVDQEPSSSRPRTKKEALGRKKKTPQPASTEAGDLVRNADVVDANTDTLTTTTQENNQRRNSHSDLADVNIHLMANGLSSPLKGTQQPEADRSVQNEYSDDELPLNNMPATKKVDNVIPTNQPSKTKRRQPKASLDFENGASVSGVASQDDTTLPEPMNQNAKPTNSPKKRTKKRAPRNPAPVDDTEEEVQSAHEGQPVDAESSAAGNVATRNNSVEPEGPASQPQSGSKPKGKRKRVLGQPKASLSLSQIEGDEIEDDFTAAFARRRSAVQPAARDSDVPEPSQIGGPKAPSPEIRRKPKRKRRSGNNASEDEMESILAAGPSKGRKAIKSGLSDDDRQSKRKRSSANEGKATGPWTQEELNNLGKVVNDFMDDNNLTQYEVTQLVHAVPSKAKSINMEFWDKAEQAIPQRTRKQIIERARRIYHNFVARGTWTQEQKEEVHELFETHPKKWTEIAGMINRDPKDVRDYWRNTYLVLESQVKSRWSKDEEERLREAVEENLSKIRITRENSEEPRRKSRGKSGDDEALIDWQQISAAMDLTRSRQQCKWKWVDMREKGLVGDDSISLPTQIRSSAGPSGTRINGISEELANAREDYRGMSPEEKYRLIDAIKDSGAREEKYIPWRTLVDERFRTKWHRPVLRLVWYRLRQTVPNYQDQDVEANARFLVNSYHMHQLFPRFDDNAIDEQAEETVVHYNRGKWVWKRPSGNLRAVRERQRRSSSASSRASSRLSRKVSSEILNLSDDEDGPPESRRSAELGEERGRHAHRDGPKSDEVSVNIPGHLKGEAAKKALAQARAKSKKSKAKEVAEAESRRVRSNSVAIDSDSE